MLLFKNELIVTFLLNVVTFHTQTGHFGQVNLVVFTFCYLKID